MGFNYKKIKDLEAQIEELNELKSKLLRNINEEITIQKIKTIIIREIRKIINKAMFKRETCIDDLDDYELVTKTNHENNTWSNKILVNKRTLICEQP